MARINIAFGMTGDWLKYTSVTICSILSNAAKNDDYYFYIMCDWQGIELSSLQIFFDALDLIKPAEYIFLKMNNADFEGAIHDWLGVSSSYRLKLPSMIKEDKILYLDSDIIVTKNIADLYSVDVSDYYLAAVEDKLSDRMRTRVNLQEGETFINGGVQLLNLQKFRENNLEQTIFNKLREIPFYTDQDVINDVCRDKILQLPLKYNLMVLDSEEIYQSRRKEYEEAIKNPHIIHYTYKPWKLKVPLHEQWEKYATILKKKISKINY